jgi:hypothetical protein
MARPWKDQPAFQAILNELENEKNDRAVAIVAVATLEYALQLAIEASYPKISEAGRKKLFDIGGVLHSFSRKMEFAIAMDVIDQKASDDLRALNKIRNDLLMT